MTVYYINIESARDNHVHVTRLSYPEVHQNAKFFKQKE